MIDYRPSRSERNKAIVSAPWYGWLMVAAFSLTGMNMPAGVTQYSMTVEALSTQLAVTVEAILFGDTLRASFLVLGMLASGLFHKRFGFRVTFAIGMTCQIIGQIAIPLCTNIPTYYIFKILQGCNAIAYPLYISTILKIIPERNHGMATAIFNGFFATGSGLGALVAGLVIPAFGWKASYWVLAVFAAVCALIVLALVGPADLKAHHHNSPGRAGSYASILRKPVTWALLITILTSNWVIAAVTVDLSVFSADLGHKLSYSAFLISTVSIVNLIASIGSGAISDRCSARSSSPSRTRIAVLVIGYIAVLLATLGFGILPMEQETFLLAASALMMFGAAWVAGGFWALLPRYYHQNEAASGVSICTGLSNIANPLAPLIVGVLLGSSGYWIAGWLTCGGLAVLSIFSMAVLYRRENHSVHTEEEGIHP